MKTYKTVYLAGAMHHVPPEFATTWRIAAREVLLKAGFKVLDPTGGKDLLDPKVHTTRYTPEQIVENDLKMIKKADIVLAEVSRTDIPYHGTSMEIAYAHRWGKVIYVWGGSKSYWIRYHATQIFERFEDALQHMLYGSDL